MATVVFIMGSCHAGQERKESREGGRKGKRERGSS